MSGIALISFSDSLLVYRSATDLCIYFVSCNFTEFISSEFFFVAFLGFSILVIYKQWWFYYFLIWMLFIFPALVKGSSTTLNRDLSWRHPCLLPNPEGKNFNFSPLNVSYGLVTYGLYVEVHSRCTYFIISGCWIVRYDFFVNVVSY